MVECKLCGMEFEPEGIHKEVCPTCYGEMVNDRGDIGGEDSVDDYDPESATETGYERLQRQGFD